MIQLRYRTILGLLVFAVAVFALFSEDVAGILPLPETLLTVLGVLLLIVSGYSLQQWTNTSRREPTVPVPETKETAPTPGEEIDRKLTQIQAQYTSARANELRTELRQLARWTLVTRTTMTADEAGTMLESGEWTANPHAAAFFAGGYPDWTSRSLRLRMRMTTPARRFQRQAIHAIKTIDDLHRDDAPADNGLRSEDEQ